MAGTVVVSTAPIKMGGVKYTVSWTSDGSGNADSSIVMNGWLVKLVTDPGSAAPTDNYDVTLVDENSIDALADKGLDRDTANTEQVYPVATGAATPIYLSGSHTFTIANAGASKNGTAVFYVLNSL